MYLFPTSVLTIITNFDLKSSTVEANGIPKMLSIKAETRTPFGMNLYIHDLNIKY